MPRALAERWGMFRDRGGRARHGIVRRDGAESTDQAAAPPARKPFRDLVWTQIGWLVQQ